MKSSLYPSNPILLVDDEEEILESLNDLLRLNGINNVITCNDSREVATILGRRQVELLVLDLRMPHVSGREVLRIITADYPDTPVIIITAVEDITTAVDCMKAGAFDYMVKPVDEERLITGVRRAVQIRELRSSYRELRDRFFNGDLANPEAFSAFITRSRKVQSLFLYIESIASSIEPVLVVGETGVGKSIVAEAVHKTSGRSGRFVAVNIAGLDDTMISDTLFGHLKGSFTGATESRQGLIAQATDGTVFLDEIGDLSIASQTKLLRLLDTREFFPIGADHPSRTNARMIFATNRDMEELVREGRFRKDLYFRLSTHELRIPPLKERRDDLPLLVNHFLAEAAASLGRKKPGVHGQLINLLATYSFPGNVRELRSMVFHAVSVSRSTVLPLRPFRELIGRHGDMPAPRESSTSFSFGDRLPTIKQITEMLIDEAMNRSGGNQSIAAGLLGISHQALNQRLKRRGRENRDC
jgi:DNA-binding NtrC family response regulator